MDKTKPSLRLCIHGFTEGFLSNQTNQTNQLNKETTMFTMTFIENENSKTVVSAAKYEVNTYDNGIKGVIVYDKFNSFSGIEFKVTGDSKYHHPSHNYPYFEVCYVTNQDGKTIDRIEAKIFK